MKRPGAVKFPHAVQLFKLCQKVLADNKNGSKVHDQEIGSILEFNPSDCSHWKKGEKNVRSIFALSKLAKDLKIELSLMYDVASGQTDLDEAYFEHTEMLYLKKMQEDLKVITKEQLAAAREKVSLLAQNFLTQAAFVTPPLYLPEVLRLFPFITTQSWDMMDRLSRILRTKPGQYTIQFKKGELKPQIRYSIIKDLARILFEGERNQFAQTLKEQPAKELLEWEKFLFLAELLMPQEILRKELAKIDPRKNLLTELATTFWVPKFLAAFKLEDLIKTESAKTTGTTTSHTLPKAAQNERETSL